jgi:hypothetical protein
MSRKERRAKARSEKIENLYRPVKANHWVLIAIAVAAAIIVIVTQAIRFGGN